MTTEPERSEEPRGGIPLDSFANRLMLARAHAGHLSIREAADLCGLGRGAWTNWEKGARPADIIDIATAVAEKLDVDRDWLLFGGQLSTPEGRSTGRRQARRAGGPPAIAHYCGTAERTSDRTPRVTRAPGHPPIVRVGTGGAGRTSHIPRVPACAKRSSQD